MLAFNGSLGPALEGPLVESCRRACGGTLTDIRWFRSDWQRGGGSTASARLVFPDGLDPEVIIKLPVGVTEFRWTCALSTIDQPDASTPRVFAAGQSLGGIDDGQPGSGGYDIGWLVIEKLSGLPLGARLDAGGITDMLGALAEFHDRAGAIAAVPDIGDRPPARMGGSKGIAGGSLTPGAQPRTHNWDQLLHASRDVIHRAESDGRGGANNGTAAAVRLASAQRWKHAVHDVQKHLPQLLRRWDSRHINTWCHGDMHPGNAMRRATSCELENGHRPGNARSANLLGPCVLIDLALIHPGHWIEDVLYFERVYWGRAEQLRGVNLVSTLARIRRERGHNDHEDYGMLANVRRVLSAAAAPGLLEREGNPKYLAYALEVIQRLLPQVGR